MPVIQPIHHGGRLVALVAGGRAFISGNLPDLALPAVRAKCLYALEIQAGQRPGPYADGDAAGYAHHALVRRRRHGLRR